MASVEVLPLDDYPDGTYNFGPVLIDDGVDMIDLSAARCTTLNPDYWPLTTTVVASDPQISLDGGETWAGVGGGTAEGDIFVSPKSHQEVPFWVSGGGSLPAGTDRLYKLALVITGGPWRSRVTIEVN